jgi:hypothetical protein
MQVAKCIVTLLLVLPLGACELTSRVEKLEETTAIQSERLDGLSERLDRLQGYSVTELPVPSGATDAAIFGNQSGHNAVITITNTGQQAEFLDVKIRRISRPSDRQVEPTTGAPRTNLPVDFERTEWLSIATRGARRQLVVPCSFEVIARNGSTKSKVSLLIKYEKDRCEAA